MSWLVSMPSRWELRSPKSLFDERRTPNLPDDVHLTPSQKYGVVPQSEYIELTGGSVVLNLTGQNTMKHVEPDDFIIHLRSFQGGLEHARQPGKVSTAYTVIQPKNAIKPGFFRWLLKSSAFIQELQTTTNQLRDGQSIRWSDFVKVPLPTPPLDEQRAIADYLDRETQKIDRLITEQRSLIEILRERRIALISRAVRLGLNLQVEHQVTGVDWLGDIPSHWEVKRLKYSVESVLPGVWGSEPIGDESDVRCVRVADFDRPHLRVGDDIPTMRSVAPNDRQSRALRAGDLLIEKSGGTAINPVGFVAIYEGGDESTVYANFIARMRPSVGQVSRYWLYAHAASYATRLTFRSVKQTTGIQNLDQSAYFDELFPFPPPEEQREIVNYLDDQTSRIDELISESEDLIDLSQERRAALITAAVTGQIDVRTAA